jgi:hypothetical protein
VQHADVQLLIILVYSHSQQHQGDNGVSATRPGAATVRAPRRIMEFRTKMLEGLRNDAEAAADAIDEAQQQLKVLYKSIRDAHAAGHTVPELEQATGLPPRPSRTSSTGPARRSVQRSTSRKR